MILLDQIQIIALKRIPTTGGDVLHALKSTEDAYHGFGEAYFSFVEPGVIKAWKQHLRMIMNLVVPVGSVRFVFHDSSAGTFREEIIGESNYQRLTVPPKIWFGFQGLAATPSLLLNLACLPHDVAEVKRKTLAEVQFNWQSER